jgi:hypothetical protein
MNFLPLKMQVNFLVPTVSVFPGLVHLSPAFAVAAKEGAEHTSTKNAIARIPTTNLLIRPLFIF